MGRRPLPFETEAEAILRTDADRIGDGLAVMKFVRSGGGDDFTRK